MTMSEKERAVAMAARNQTAIAASLVAEIMRLLRQCPRVANWESLSGMGEELSRLERELNDTLYGAG